MLSKAITGSKALKLKNGGSVPPMRFVRRQIRTTPFKQSTFTTLLSRNMIQRAKYCTKTEEIKDDAAKKEADKKNLLRLISFVKDEKKTLGFALLALAFSSGATLLMPAAMGRVMDNLATAGGSPEMNMLMAGFTGVFAVASVASYFRTTLLTAASERIVMNLRNKLFQSLVNQDITFFDHRRSGELLNRLSTDTQVMSKSLLDNFASGLRRLIEGIGGLAVLFYLAPKLTFSILMIIPPVFLGAYFYAKRAKKLSTKVVDALAFSTEFAEERISSIRTVRSFAQEMRELGEYAKRTQSVFEIAMKVAKTNGAFFGAVFFSVSVSMLSVLYFGAHFVQTGAMTVGELTSFLLYAVYVGSAFSGIGNFYSEVIRALGSSQRVFELLDSPSAIEVEGGKVLDKLNGPIRFQNIRFAYPTRGEVDVLNDFTLTLNPGQTVAVVGQSGSGKSTLAALLLRFYQPSAGAVLVGDQDIAELDPKWLRSQIGVVPQDVVLFSGNILENIKYGYPDATDEEAMAAAKQANAHQFITSFPDGYETTVGERGVALSGGQKQRIAIARALLKNPSILVLDEATSALDGESEYAIQQALETIMVGRTVLIIAHRLSTIKNAHKIAVLDSGVVKEQGTFAELTSDQNGYFARLVQRTDPI